MVERWIGDGAKKAEPSRVRTNARGVTRLGSLLASPIGIMITVPTLVVGVALFFTIVGQAALRQSMLSMAEERFRQKTLNASQSLEEALLHADVVLDRLKDYDEVGGKGYDFVPLALVLRDLTLGRPGMSQAYIGFPSGEYFGVYEEGEELLFQHSTVENGRTHIDHFAYTGSGLTPRRQEVSDYDPRQRVWYKLAAEKGRPVWTGTYPFFTTGHTGVTRAAPIFQGGSTTALRAVAAVDFDVSALSRTLARSETPNAHSLIYAADGSILAFPLGAESIERTRTVDHALRYGDLHDPLLDAYFAALPKEATNDVLRAFDAGGRTMLTSSSPVHIDGLPWTAAIIAPEDVVLAPLARHQRRSLSLGGAAVVVALVISLLFARHVTRQRRQVAEAREEAAQAERMVKELGSYRLVSRLGKGGMGEVWRAQHQLLAREAAIKLINSELMEGVAAGEVVERFRREAQTIAALRSRNTVALFDYGVTGDGTFFYVMEMLDGIDLETLVERYGPQPAGRVINILVQACNSLGEAHEVGLVHRDVKPANLFLCRAADEVDVVKVLDFGLVMARNEDHPLISGPPSPSGSQASAPSVETLSVDDPAVHEQPISGSHPSSDSLAGKIGRLTRAGDYLGTPAFIAPEQALGHAVDGRADLYALACIAFWLLTAHLPYDEPTALSMMVAHIKKPVPRVSDHVSGALPEGLEQLLLECMSKEPGERPPTARAFAQALKNIVLTPEQQFGDHEAHEWWSHYIPTASDAAVSTMPTIDSGSQLLGTMRIADAG